MSSQNRAPSETAPLLGDSQLADLWSENCRFRCSPQTLLIPVALATRLASMIQLTTFVELVRQVVCRLWKISHTDNPATLPEHCDVPEIAQYFATAVAILGTIEGILSIDGCGILRRFSSHYGRKPTFLLLLIVGFMGSSLIPGSQYSPDWIADWVFLVGMLFQLFSSPTLYGYLVNTYIVDVCVPENRTATLSKITGWATLGSCIALALGGFVTTKTGNSLIVFYASAAIYITTLIYVVFALPESFPEDKRNVLSRMNSESLVDGPLNVIRLIPLTIFEPLKMFLPTRKSDGSRSWRLAWCAVHILIFMAVNGYVSTAWVVLVTSKYHLTPADTGFFLATVTISATIFLTVIVPPLVRFLRPYYNRKIARSPLAEEGITNGEEFELELGTSDRLDAHLAFMSCVIVAVFFLTAAASTTNSALIISGICIGFAYMHVPTVRSLVAGSVDPLKQEEALTAIEIVSSAGACLSPIIMGSLVSATIGTAPLLPFYVHLVVVLVSGALLFLVRGVDRYHSQPR